MVSRDHILQPEYRRPSRVSPSSPSLSFSLITQQLRNLASACLPILLSYHSLLREVCSRRTHLFENFKIPSLSFLVRLCLEPSSFLSLPASFSVDSSHSSASCSSRIFSLLILIQMIWIFILCFSKMSQAVLYHTQPSTLDCEFQGLCLTHLCLRFTQWSAWHILYIQQILAGLN